MSAKRPAGGVLERIRRLLNKPRPGDKHPYFRVAPLIVITALVTAIRLQTGSTTGLETAALDTWMRFQSARMSADIVLVCITDEDYRKEFASTSPLDPSKLADVIRAVDAGAPALVAVDVDTSDTRFQPLQNLRTKAPILWARSAAQNGPLFEPDPVLGLPEPAVASGLTIFPEDKDGAVRRYQRRYPTKSGSFDSLPWAIVTTFRQSNPKAGRSTAEMFALNFYGDRFHFKTASSAQIQALAAHPGWGKEGTLLFARIALIGGTYREARDEFFTPVGRMSGIDLLAHTTEAELSGRGLRPLHSVRMILLNFLGGFSLVLVYHRFSLRIAFWTSLLLIPLVALLSSALTFSTLALWFNFVPVLLVVLISQLYGQAKQRWQQHLS